jgi:hypothetical protein
MTVQLDGQPVTVNSILDLNDPNTRIYESHPGMTQDWAKALVDLGYPSSMPLSYDRVTGGITHTLGELAGSTAGTAFKTFHFVLNNTIVKDNRIPPYGMTYNAARERNALPEPADQFGNPGAGGTYDYFDIFQLDVPGGSAQYAEISLIYQPTSWEYVQFLYLNNTGQNAFLADEGRYLLEAWLNTGMAEPYVMATAEWGKKVTPPMPLMWVTGLSTWCVDRKGNITTGCDSFAERETMAYVATIQDEGGTAISGAQVFTNIVDGGGNVVHSQQAFSDAAGEASFTWRVPRRQTPGQYSIVVTDVIQSSYEYDATNSLTEVVFFIQ